MFDFEVAVVIPMAGFSKRFPSSCPKQYFKVLDKPLFMFCVEEFFKLDYINKICLVCDRVEFVQSIIEETFKRQEKIVAVNGGNSRHISIRNGLIELSKFNNLYKVVVVHDGARPLVPEELLVKVILEAATHGAAGATRPLISTVVKPLIDGHLEASLNRNEYLLSETPQAFLFPLIMNAYQKCSKDDLEEGTECLELILKYCDVRAKLIPGPESLWKVTDKKDFHCVTPYLTELFTDVCLLGEQESEILQRLIDSLRNRVRCVDCFVTKINPETDRLYNIIICLHENMIDEESQLISFGTLLDVNRQGLVIHVVKTSNSEGFQSTSICELHRSGSNITKQFEKLKKGVVFIYYLSHGEEEKLIELIASLIFIDSTAISGQTLFL